jgi:hypothetical protein
MRTPAAPLFGLVVAQSRTEIVPLGDMIARESLDMMEASLVAASRTPSA